MSWELQQHRLELLRQRRVRPEREVALTPIIREETRLLKQTQRALAGIATAWEQTVPPALAGNATLVSLSRGTLTVRVNNPTIKFGLDRFLRGGGEHALIQAAPPGVRKVKVVVG